MSRLTLVRHGEAAAGWGDDADPGLSPLGRAQAQAMADALSASPVRPILVSPMRRTLETAEPLAERWNTDVVVEPRVGEIQTPKGLALDRSAWLASVLSSRWSELDHELRAWADGVAAHLLALAGDAVVISHFVAINVVLGRASGNDRVVAARVAHCARTVLETGSGRFRLLEAPHEVADTDVR